MAPSPSSPDGADPDAVLRLQFETAIAKFLVTQTDQLRGLENALRDESIAMLRQLHDQVCAQITTNNQSATIPATPGLLSMIDELFARPEVQHGLVELLGEEGDSKRANMLVEELRVDIKTGEGNDTRATFNKLLPPYMEALYAMCGKSVPAASPGGRNSDKKLLGHLTLGGNMYAGDKNEGLRESAKRLKSVLFVFLNIRNFASHNRGKLSFCLQVELGGAVGAMAETFPLICQACQVVNAARVARTGQLAKPRGPPTRTGTPVPVVGVGVS